MCAAPEGDTYLPELQDGVSPPSLSGALTINHKKVDGALNPAWRDAAVHLISSVSWDDHISDSDAQKAIAITTNGTGYALRQLAPDSGVYYNEVSYVSAAALDTLAACSRNINIYSRRTRGSRTGNGPSGVPTMPGPSQSSASMILTACSGVTIVWAVSHLSSKRMGPCVLSFRPEAI
jgi:hypothetical protein